jgi:hypothetical protein
VSSKTPLPVIAMLGALFLHASSAHAGEDLVAPSHDPGDRSSPAPAVERIPPASDAPRKSVPGSGYAPEPKSMAPVSPVPALSLTEPKMVNKPRTGFLVAGLATFLPAYLLQAVAAFGVAMSGIDGLPGYNYGEAGLLTLIPIVGPWLGPSSVGESLPFQWTLAWGAIEAAGVAMFVTGIVGHDVPEEPAAPKVSLAPFVTPEAHGLSLSLRW